jgi:polyvinyl alcohol dehydrogenase (cytochrome)
MIRAFDWVKAACGVAACGFLMASMPVALADDEGPSDGQWTMSGQNLSGWRNQDDTGISPRNVAKLKKEWAFTAGGNIQATPAVAGGVVYFPDLAGNFYALKAADGSVKWQQKVATWTGVPGDSARHTPAIVDNVLILGDQGGAAAKWNGGWLSTPGASVMAINTSTGALIWVTQVEAFPAAVVTSSPVVHKNVVYVGIASLEEGTAANPAYPCCSFRGSVVALDLKTGKILWKTFTVPDNHGQTGGYSGGSIWGSPVVDPKRNSLYVGVGNNYSVPIADETCAATKPMADCFDPHDHFDSAMALDLTSGAIKWATHAMHYDAWNVACVTPGEPATNNCPKPTGVDYDFGSGPNLFPGGNDRDDDLLGIGQKSGIYWAFNPDNGKIVWDTQVGPGGDLGGIEWGPATDGARIYVPVSNSSGLPYAPPSGVTTNGGSWAALDPKTGKIMWQTATPGTCISLIRTSAGCMALGPASVAGGVVFAGSMDTNKADPTMFALDASSGKILWSFIAGSPVVAGPAIVGNSVYWGSGPTTLLATNLGFPSNNQLFKFSIGDH